MFEGRAFCLSLSSAHTWTSNFHFDWAMTEGCICFLNLVWFTFVLFPFLNIRCLVCIVTSRRKNEISGSRAIAPIFKYSTAGSYWTVLVGNVTVCWSWIQINDGVFNSILNPPNSWIKQAGLFSISDWLIHDRIWLCVKTSVGCS